MEPTDEAKELNDELVTFMRKCSQTDVPRYTARLKTYVDIREKRKKAAIARTRHSDQHRCRKIAHSPSKKQLDVNEKDKNADNSEHPGSENGRVTRRRAVDEKGLRGRSLSRSRSGEPSDRCGRRRRRRRKRCGRRRRRRRSCRRRRRRRRSCRRRRRRRSRRSCSRRRRRRSCGRRRKRRRRRRC